MHNAMHYSRGIFFNLLSSDHLAWSEDLAQLRGYDGIGHVEILAEAYPAADEILYLDAAIGDLSRVMHGPYVGVTLASPDHGIREAGIDRLVDFARLGELLSCQLMTVHSGLIGQWEDRDAGISRLSESLDTVADRSPIPIALENMPSRGGGSREPVARLEDMIAIAQLNSRVKFTLDIGHVLQSGDAEPSDYLRLLGDRIANIHLHDAHIRGVGHLALGEGDLDLPRLIRSLHDMNYRRFVALETVSVEDTTLSWKRWGAQEGRPSE